MTKGTAVAVVAALALSASAPPAWFPGAEWAVLPGLSALYAVATAARRPYLLAYATGVAYMLAFSASLRHVSVAGYVAIGVVGGGYYALLAAWPRAVGGGWRPLLFGCGVAATHWLRAHMPEIYYPHGQPAHALYEWPAALGIIGWGGEAAANAVLGWFAAAAVECWRAWRLGLTPLRRAGRGALLAAAPWLAAATFSPPAAAPATGGDRLLVGIVQPNRAWRYGNDVPLADLIAAIVDPTLGIAAPGAAAPPDLVLWPESCYPDVLVRRGGREWLWPRWSPYVDAEGREHSEPRPPFALRLAPRTVLCAGTGLWDYVDDGAGGERLEDRAVALLLDARGRVLDWHEKARPVPAGERVPWIGWLPAGAEAAAAAWLRENAGIAHARPGRSRPPLRTASGVPFAALSCYDNAFVEPAWGQVARGARLLCVISNESWYRGGAELDQLVAMSVVRALETATPVVRCTMDGASLVVTGDGRLADVLPRGHAGGEPRAVVVDVALGAGAIPPLAWLHLVIRWVVLATSLIVVGHAAAIRCRIPALRLRPAAGVASSGTDPGGGGLDQAR